MRVERIGNAVLYLGDCLEILPTLPKVDAVITDPPYGIGFMPATRSTKKGDIYAGGAFRTGFAPIAGDFSEFDPSPFVTFPCVLWGANNYASKLPASNGWLCWYKCGGITGFNMSECELAWTNILTSTKYIDHLWHGFKRKTQVGERVNHPTEKPIAVMEWAIKQVCNPQTILDPYMGSGTTGVACMRLGSAFVGIEIEPKYFDIACERIENAQRQQSLLDPHDSVTRSYEQVELL